MHEIPALVRVPTDRNSILLAREEVDHICREGLFIEG
jgi:hypothetical protein